MILKSPSQSSSVYKLGRYAELLPMAHTVDVIFLGYHFTQSLLMMLRGVKFPVTTSKAAHPLLIFPMPALSHAVPYLDGLCHYDHYL